jgi:transcription termination factor Rho
MAAKKKAATKKATRKKAPAKKTPTARTAAKKSPAGKSAKRKAPARKSAGSATAKKTAGRKTTSRKTAARRPRSRAAAAEETAERVEEAPVAPEATGSEAVSPEFAVSEAEVSGTDASGTKASETRASGTKASGMGPAEADPAKEREPRPGSRPASIGLRRARRPAVSAPRGGPATNGKSETREIPPLPDDDGFVPPPEPRPGRSRRRRRRSGGSPHVRLLERVRNGREHVSALDDLDQDEIAALARRVGIEPAHGASKSETIVRLVNEAPASRQGEAPTRTLIDAEGLLELHPDGYGFLRRPRRNYTQHPADVYVAAGLVRRYGLQAGHWITGKAHRPRPNQPDLALYSVEEVNHEPPARLHDLVPFDKLTVVYPDTRFILETVPEDVEMRVMDLFCPLGRGQRGLIVAPPRTGKTIMLTKLADAIATNSPDVDIVVLLVDERPEEVTNMRRSVRGEVIASTFDRPASNHVRVAELVMEKVKRMVEFGRHVVLLLDSITRLGRAYNNQTGGSGRILSGGLDAKALTKPKRFFGSARNVEDGGSLTIVATALVDTGSKMDQVIFEEFKGTGNMELVLSREMANSRVWPAIDVPASGTRNEDLLMHPDELRRVTLLRRGITGQDPQTVMLALRDQLKQCSTNAEFLMKLGN